MAPTFGKNNRMPLNYYYDEEHDVALPIVAKTGVSAVKMYWLLTLICSMLGGIVTVGIMLSQRGGRAQIGGRGDILGSLVFGIVLLVMAFPAVQLGSAFITLIWLAASSRQDRSYQLGQLGKITLGLFVGAGAGIVAMVAVGVMLSMR